MSTQTPFSGLTGDQRAVELVKARHTLAEQAQSVIFSKYDKWFRMYKNERVEYNYKGFSNIRVPKAFEKVERGTGILAQAIKRIRIIPQGEEDKESGEMNERLIEFEDRVLNIPKIRKQWIKSARIHGQSYLKVTWDVGKEEPERPYKGIDISLPDPKTIFYNPDHTPDKPFRWVIHDMDVPYEELSKNKSFDKEALLKAKDTATLGKNTAHKGRKGRTGNKGDWKSDETTLMVNVKEYYGPYQDTDESDVEPYRIIMANNEHILKKGLNPYAEILDDPIPIIPLYTYVVPHEPHAMGDIEATESLIIELNDTRNQRMDTVTQNIDPPKEVLKAAQISESDLVAKRGWIIHSSMPNGIKWVHPDMQGVIAAINEEKIIQGDIDRTLGIPSFGAETPVAGDLTTDTATGINATLQAQDVISNSILEEVKEALKKFYRAILAYNQTFIDREFKITVLEEDVTNVQGEQMAPEEIEGQPAAQPAQILRGGMAMQPFTVDKDRIKGNFDLDVEVELVGNRLARRAEALAAIKIIGQIPGAKHGRLIEDYLRTHDKYNIEDYWQPPEPPAPEAPKVSVSLRGELGDMRSAQVYKNIPGVNEALGDPAFSIEGRKIMRGELPENEERDDKDREIEEKKKEKVEVKEVK